MKRIVVGVSALVLSSMMPSSANATAFVISIGGIVTGKIYPYCRPGDGPGCFSNVQDVTLTTTSPSWSVDLSSGANQVSIGQYNRIGQWSGTVIWDGVNLTGQNLTYSYQGCSGGTCPLTIASAPSFGVAASAGVPEPGTWMMMIAGFGAIGWSLRRRRAARKRAVYALSA